MAPAAIDPAPDLIGLHTAALRQRPEHRTVDLPARWTTQVTSGTMRCTGRHPAMRNARVDRDPGCLRTDLVVRGSVWL